MSDAGNHRAAATSGTAADTNGSRAGSAAARAMRPVSYAVRDGRATYDGRTLAEWVPEVVDRLVERFAPSRVVLFGSVARGDGGRDSDIDLLVILSELRTRHHDAAVAMLRSLRDLPVPVDLVVTDVSELEERSAAPGVIRVALREGTTVHG
ncbi:MAG: nucleotidyltransferase domain-containing protein [Acidimicrobiales bacterium]